MSRRCKTQASSSQKIASGFSGEPVPRAIRSGAADEQKLIAIQLPRMLDGSFEIQIVENAHAHRDQRQAMKRVM